MAIRKRYKLLRELPGYSSGQILDPGFMLIGGYVHQKTYPSWFQEVTWCDECLSVVPGDHEHPKPLPYPGGGEPTRFQESLTSMEGYGWVSLEDNRRWREVRKAAAKVLRNRLNVESGLVEWERITNTGNYVVWSSSLRGTYRYVDGITSRNWPTESMAEDEQRLRMLLQGQ